jgi:eukaryotic-like serine/threonine-protein kinase
MGEAGRFGRESIAFTAETETRAADPGELPEGVAPAPAREKYEIEAPIGAGGMGEVLLVRDHDLRRQIAMKVMRSKFADNEAHRLRFIAEAQATSQLDHPGIPPVHDMGIAPDGRLYFTMKLVRGRTLREVLKDLVLGVLEVRREYTMHRMVTVLQRVSEAVHFAHEKGVVHRDLKPENIMLGSYGEVHVMDWGIAKLMEQPLEEYEVELQVTTDDAVTALETRVGTVKGTIAYMSPEQAEGRTDELDRRSDVFALGCILYEILTLQPVYDWNATNILERVRAVDFVPVGERNPRRPVPEALGAICSRALETRAEDRPETAKVFADGLRRWLDGTSEKGRRHGEAERLVVKGREAVRRYEASCRQAEQAEALCEQEQQRVLPHQSVKEKGALFNARTRLEQARREAVVCFAEAIRLLDGALIAEEDNAAARGVLIDLWGKRLGEAEQSAQAEDAEFALAMLQRYDDGRATALIRGDGRLRLTSEPTGAAVHLCRLEDRNGLLVGGHERSVGATPVDQNELPMGSYVCRVVADGRPEVVYPVHITRGRDWKGQVRCRTTDEIGEGFVFVPGGPAVIGERKTKRTVDVGDFVIQATPVTFAEYAEFLAGLEQDGGAEAVARFLPGTAEDDHFMERGDDGVYRVISDLVEGEARDQMEGFFGPNFAARLPAIGVSWELAVAYCVWKSRTTGEAWRLPTAFEREKAARGVDGRCYPWGELQDASLGKCNAARALPSQPEPVGGFPAATSVYGMQDAAGNCWEWTSTWSDELSRTRLVYGGSWSSPIVNLRCAATQSYTPDLRLAVVGFRCARSL